MELPQLTTPRLVLRRFVPDDAERVRELAGDPGVALMTSDIPHPYEEGMAEAWIASHEGMLEAGERIPFAAELPDEGVIGAVALRLDAEHERAELGYWFGRPYWGMGYATEACRAVVRYGFGELGVRRIYARHLPENVASARVLEKLGMVKEGVLRQHVLHRGKRAADMVMWGVLADEFAVVDAGGTDDARSGT